MKKRFLSFLAVLLLLSLLVGCADFSEPSDSDAHPSESVTSSTEAPSLSADSEVSTDEREPEESTTASEPASESEPAKSDISSGPDEQEQDPSSEASSDEEDPTEITSKTESHSFSAENDPANSDPAEKKPLSEFPAIPETPSYAWLGNTLEGYESPQRLDDLPVRTASDEALFAIPSDGSEPQIKSLRDLQQKIGIDYLFMDSVFAQHAYTITRLYDAELGIDKYVYCHFEIGSHRELYPNGYYDPNVYYERWTLRGQCIISRKFSIVDIALIKEGDLLSKLAALDPAFEKALNAEPTLISTEYFELLLEDGWAGISSEKDAETGEIIITKLERVADALKEYTYPTYLSPIPLPEARIPDNDTAPKLPMSQFPMIFDVDETNIGWLEATLKGFTQSAPEDLPARNVGYLEGFFGTIGHPFTNSIFFSLSQVQKLIGLDYVTLLDENHVCTITKIEEEESGEIKYIYAIFERELYRGLRENNREHSLYESWVYTTESYHVSAACSYEDLSQLSIGDPAEKVLALAPALASDSLLLLEDGLLRIQVDYTAGSEHGTVSGLSFHPYGEALTFNGVDIFMAVSPVRPPLPADDAESEAE